MTENPSSDAKVTIKIPRPLYNSIKSLIEDSGFNSVNDFVVYILRDIAAVTKADAGGQFETGEIESIKERLRNLGYLSSMNFGGRAIISLLNPV